jgi:chromosome segregation ATPase
MPEEPVGIDDAVLSAVADLLSTVENLGKRLKALESTVPGFKTQTEANQQRSWARLGAQETQLNTTNEALGRLAQEVDTTQTRHKAVVSDFADLKAAHTQSLSDDTRIRAEFRQVRQEMEALRTVAGKAVKAANKADEQFNEFHRMRDDLNKLIRNQEHERTERLEATRKFQRSMRDVAHTIAES